MGKAKRKILFVINPISGGTDKEDLYKLVKQFCVAQGYAFDLLKTTGKNDKKAIRKRIASFEPTVVVAGGGDGTVKLVAEELLDTQIKLAILPLGSANGLATELKIPKRWKANLELLKACNTKTIDAIRVNGSLCLHLSDSGFNAELIQAFEEGSTRGMMGYAISFIKQLGRRRAGRYQVKVDEGTYTYNAEMIVIANASKYGTGAVVNPRANMQDGLFEVCVFMRLPWYKILYITWRSFIGRLEESEYYAIHQTRQVSIKVRKPRILQVDGELMGKKGKIKAHILEHALDVVVK